MEFRWLLGGTGSFGRWLGGWQFFVSQGLASAACSRWKSWILVGSCNYQLQIWPLYVESFLYGRCLFSSVGPIQNCCTQDEDEPMRCTHVVWCSVDICIGYVWQSSVVEKLCWSCWWCGCSSLICCLVLLPNRHYVPLLLRWYHEVYSLVLFSSWCYEWL